MYFSLGESHSAKIDPMPYLDGCAGSLPLHGSDRRMRHTGVQGWGNFEFRSSLLAAVGVMSADRAVSPIRADCQCLRKVDQVCEVGESLLFSRVTAAPPPPTSIFTPQSALTERVEFGPD